MAREGLELTRARAVSCFCSSPRAANRTPSPSTQRATRRSSPRRSSDAPILDAPILDAPTLDVEIVDAGVDPVVSLRVGDDATFESFAAVAVGTDGTVFAAGDAQGGAGALDALVATFDSGDRFTGAHAYGTLARSAARCEPVGSRRREARLSC